MSSQTWLGIVGLIALVAFAIFAFRQGTKVPPSGRDPTDHIQPP